MDTARLAAATRLGRGCVVALLLVPVAAGAGTSPAEPAAWRVALAERFAVERVAVGRLDVEIVTSPGASSEPFRPSRLVVPLARLLEADLPPEITLADVTLRRVGDPAGWDGAAALGQVSIATGPALGEHAIVVEGTIDAAPLRIALRFAAVEPELDNPRRRRFSLTASLPGIEERLDGLLDADGEALEARLELDVSSLGDFLQLLGLRRQMEGSGRLRLAAAGPVDDLRATDIGLIVELATGEQLRADGRIASLSRLSGIELDVTANLVDAAGVAPRASAALQLDVEALRGRVTGSAEALTLDDVVVSTNLAAAGIEEIGPISVERLIRDAEGRLALSGVRIRAGDPNEPSLDLAGRIDDLLGRSGIALSGRFDLDLIGLLSGRAAPAGLGRLAGSLAIADATGRLELRQLDARQVGDGPLRLAIERLEAPPDAPALPITLRLDILDLDALAALQDKPPIGGGTASLAGTVDPGAGFRIAGGGHVGSSPLTLDLGQEVVEDQLVLEGRIESPGLLLADVPRLVGLVGLWPRREPMAADPLREELRARLDAVIDTEAIIVDRDGRRRGAFAATLTVRDDAVTLRPLRLDYLGGRANAELVIGTRQKPPPLRLEARIEALNTGTLLEELGIRPLLVGGLDAALDLAAVGPDRRALMASLDGSIELVIGEGRIGSRLLDLTALDLFSWLFSAGGDTRLVCAAARLGFASGRGTVEGLILQTENVRLVGAGEIDLARESLDLGFSPRPLRGRLVPAVTAFRVHGPLAAPAITLGSPGAMAGRMIAETLTLPLNVLGTLLGALTGGVPADCTLDP